MKKTSKIFIVLLLVIFAALSFAGCDKTPFSAGLSDISFDGVGSFIVTGLKDGSVAFVNKVQAKINKLKDGKTEILVPEEFLGEDLNLAVGDDEKNLEETEYVYLGKLEVVMQDGVADWSQSAAALAEFAPVSYIVYDNGVEIATDETSYKVSANGVKHDIKVRAVKTGAYYGIYSDTVSATILNAPMQVNASITQNDFDVTKAPVTISWESIFNCNKYNVVINDAEPVQVETNSYSATVDLSAGMKVQVQAVSEDENVFSSPYSDVQTYNFFKQIQASDITVKNGIISWPASTEEGVAGYMIEINGVKQDRLLTTPEYAGLELGSDYLIRVRTVSSNEGNTFSRWSDPIKVNILETVMNPKFVVNNNIYTFLWDSVNSAYRYNIVMKYYATLDSEPEVTEFGVTGTAVSSYNIEGFSFDKVGKYTLEVCAQGNPESGVYSSQYSIPVTVIRPSSPETVSFNDYQDFETNTRNITISVVDKGEWPSEVYRLQLDNIEISSASDENNSTTFELPLLLDKKSALYNVKITPKSLQSQSGDTNVIYLDSLDAFELTFFKLGAPENLKVINNTTKDNEAAGSYICQFDSLGEVVEINDKEYTLPEVKYYSYCNGFMIAENVGGVTMQANLPSAYELGSAVAYAMAVPSNVEIKETDKAFVYGNQLNKEDAKNQTIYLASETSNKVELLKLEQVERDSVSLVKDGDQGYRLSFGAVENANYYYISYQAPDTDGNAPMGEGMAFAGETVRAGYYNTNTNIPVPFDVVNYGYLRTSITAIGNVPTLDEGFDANTIYYVNSGETNYDAFKLQPVLREDISVDSTNITWNYHQRDIVKGYAIYEATIDPATGLYELNQIAATSDDSFNVSKFVNPSKYSIAIVPIIKESAEGYFEHEITGDILNGGGVNYENIENNDTDNALGSNVKIAIVDFTVLETPELLLGGDTSFDASLGLSGHSVYWKKQSDASSYSIIAGGKNITYNAKEVDVNGTIYMEYQTEFTEVGVTEISVQAIGNDQVINSDGTIKNAVVNSGTAPVRVEVVKLATPELDSLSVKESDDATAWLITPEYATSVNGYNFRIGTTVYTGEYIKIDKSVIKADYVIRYALKGDKLEYKYEGVKNQLVYYVDSEYSGDITIGVIGAASNVIVEYTVEENDDMIVTTSWRTGVNGNYALYRVDYKIYDANGTYLTGSSVVSDSMLKIHVPAEYKGYYFKATITVLSNSMFFIPNGEPVESGAKLLR